MNLKKKKRVNKVPVVIDNSLSCIEVYTDGSAMKNGFGGPGTHAFIVVENNVVVHEYFNYEASTTNNRQEMSAVLSALHFIQEEIRDQVLIHTDSSYVYNGCTDWIHKWHRNGYKRDGGDIPNRDLWEQIQEKLSKLSNVQFKWVKGHADNEWNNYTDELCTKAYSKGNKSSNVTTSHQGDKRKSVLIKRVVPKIYSQEDMIEMLEWINENGWGVNPPIWSNGEQMDDITGKGTYTEMSSKELFDLWWSYKTNKSNSSLPA